MDYSHIDFNKFCVSKRGPGKHLIDFGVSDYYKYYKKTVSFRSSASKYGSKDPDIIIEEKLYKKIIRDFFSLVARDLMFKAQIVKIPLLGEFSIRKKKMDFKLLSEKKSGLKIDYKKSKEAKTIVYHLNEHRNNCSYKFLWNKMRSNLHHNFYYFAPTRQNKRLLAQTLLTDKKIDFFEEKPKKIYIN